MLTAFRLMLWRDLRLALRQRGDASMPVLFYVLLLIAFPLALPPEAEVQRLLAPAGLWIAALVSHLLALERLYRDDLEDGFLEMMLLSPLSPFGMLGGRLLAHWLISGLPVVLIAPLYMAAMQLPPQTMLNGVAALLLGTPVLTLLGGILAALTMGLPRGGLLLGLLALPLYLPVLVFGAGIMQASLVGLPVAGLLYLLGALLVLALTLAPPAILAALRLSVE